jgi:hypothetical protein
MSDGPEDSGVRGGEIFFFMNAGYLELPLYPLIPDKTGIASLAALSSKKKGDDTSSQLSREQKKKRCYY